MAPIIKKISGKSQIVKDDSFCTLLENKLTNSSLKYTSIVKSFDKEIKKIDPDITNNALNNAHGDWYEWLLAIAGWNYSIRNKTSAVPLLLPKISQFDLAELYTTKFKNLIFDLREKVEKASNVKLITSNPDFILIRKELFNKHSKNPKEIKDISNSKLHLLINHYKKFIGLCDFKDIIGYIGVKFSLRPDRRLQLPHEGSLMKALYAHLQTREWIINPLGLKYYAISTEIKPKDYQALKTVATHSITNVSNLPQAAVDEVFGVNSVQEANKAYETILKF